MPKRDKRTGTQSGISQRDLATRLNTNVTTLSRYETGQVTPSVEMAATLAKAVNASLDKLTGLAGPDDPLVELSRALVQTLTKEHRVALAAHLRMVLELVGK